MIGYKLQMSQGTELTLIVVSLFSLSTLCLKSLLTPDVCVETCESLNGSMASLTASDHSDSPQYEAQTLERISTLTGVRHQSRTQMNAAVSACLCRLVSQCSNF